MEFNVSHHGSLVALVGCVGHERNLGVDVVQLDWDKDHAAVQEKGFDAWAKVYADVFSERENLDIAHYMPQDHGDSGDDIKAKLRHFYAHWALKEAYVKLTGEALMAPWLKDLEFHNVQVPKPPDGMRTGRDWGEICSGVEIWFHGRRLNDVHMELQSFRDDYIIATACSDSDTRLSPFVEVDVERDIYAEASG